MNKKTNSIEYLSNTKQAIIEEMKKKVKDEDKNSILLKRIKDLNKRYLIEEDEEEKEGIKKVINTLNKIVQETNENIKIRIKKLKVLINKYITLKEKIVISNSNENIKENKKEKINEIFNVVYLTTKAEYYETKRKKFKMFSQLIIQ